MHSPTKAIAILRALAARGGSRSQAASQRESAAETPRHRESLGFLSVSESLWPYSLCLAARVDFHHGLLAVTCLTFWLALAAVVHGQSAENVAVVINDNSADSQRIAEHYARTRGLPQSNVLRIQTSSEDAIERDTYVRTIEQPLGLAIRRAGLQDRLLYLVLTKGVPLRIVGTTGVNGTLASVDSELTLLYRRLVGQPILLQGKIDNPYYLGVREIGEARPFSHREHDIYLVTRIDAFTVDQALALIDRAQSPAMEGRAKEGRAMEGRIVLDQRGAAGSGDKWLEQAARRLADQGQQSRVVLETTAKPARDEKAVLGYYSSGASDPANRVRSVGMGFTPGSIAANLASFDARTFRQPPDDWRPTVAPDKATWFEGSGDALIGDLIRDGVTGVSGQVAEAYVLGAVRPEVLFPAYLAGFNLAEAFYLAVPALSWQTVVVGDPLCAPFGRKPLAREQLEDVTDAATGLPGLFAKRRLAVLLAANQEIPEAAGPLVVRFQTLLERDDRVGARRALEEALRLAPRAVALMVSLAQLEEQAGEDDAAIARYRRILDVQPANVVALNNLAFALAVRHNAAAEALPLARRAVGLAPRSGTVLDTLGWVEHLLGNHDVAANLLGQAVRLEPGHAEIRLHAAIVYMASGKSDRAEMELKEALRLDPALEGRDEVRQLRQGLAAVKPVVDEEPHRAA
ncbi:MAG: hypothetical protein DMF96_02305 [Acidobacteria bacterium]|nr:MAG: hypothetical protein DMF96_02305 [Acidobacteriota bacterium]